MTQAAIPTLATLATVDITALSAGYGAKVVLSLDRFAVQAGQHTLVLGPSGCGKTTLLNIVAGIATAQSGDVVIHGISLGGLSGAERDHFRSRHIGFVLQRLHLISALSVFDNLALVQRLAGLPVDRPRIDAILRELGIAALANALPKTLSQGEAQRAAIARAVTHRPALILADEPTAALDDENCEAAMDLMFAQAAEHGATLLVATHDARIKPRFAQVLELKKAEA